jgi:hypothetical protein
MATNPHGALWFWNGYGVSGRPFAQLGLSGYPSALPTADFLMIDSIIDDGNLTNGASTWWSGTDARFWNFTFTGQ